ncbi:hypothetical protein [Rhodocaloribacter sp.]
MKALTIRMAVLALASLPVLSSRAQQAAPLSNLVLVGYGTTTYNATLNSEFNNNFGASLSPIALYQMGEDFLFESELEFELEDAATETELEYAQIDYQGFENVQFIAGKFLLPFGLFSERLHPSWINRLPAMPLTYGHAHAGVAEGALLPVLSDAGLMLRYKQPLSTGWAFDLSAWVTQGPRLVDEAALEEGEAGHEHAGAAAKTLDGDPTDPDHLDETHELPLVGYGVSFGDNNKNKMLGARLGLVNGYRFEAYVSGFTAKYDVESTLDITGLNLAVEWRPGPFNFRGEGLLVRQDFRHEDGIGTYERTGYYAEVSRRIGAWEPVVRWSQLPEARLEGEVAAPERKQLALGLTYWLAASIPVKVAYLYDPDEVDGLSLQWAFGF